MRPTRREVAWLLASWIAWAFVALHVQGPADTILAGGDHWSHMGCAQLFLHHGFDIWDHPLQAYCSHQLPPDQRAFPSESDCPSWYLCGIPKDFGSRPLCVNWQQFPQPYPPGLILYSLPQAFLYEATHLSFRTIDVLIILEYLLAAHLLLFVLYRLVFPPARRDDLLGGVRWELVNPWLRLGLFALVYLEIVKQCLNGFYDPLAIFAVMLGIWFLAKRRPADALVALSAGLFLHYRAIWYAPLFAWAAWRALASAGFKPPPRTWVKFGVAALLCGLSLFTLWLVHPFLAQWPPSNPVLWKKATRWSLEEWNLLFPMALIFLYLAWGGHWLVLVTMAWQLFVVIQTPQVMTWHALFLLPMFGVARLDEERAVMLAAFVFWLVEVVVVFRALPLPGELVSALAAHWGSWSF